MFRDLMDKSGAHKVMILVILVSISISLNSYASEAEILMKVLVDSW